MHFKIRRDLMGQTGNPHVLHDNRIRARLGKRGEHSGSIGKLAVENQRVESYIAANAAPVKRLHDVRQFIEYEADFGAGGKLRQAEIDCIRPGLNGSVQLRPVAHRDS